MKSSAITPRENERPVNGLEAFRRQFDRLFEDFGAPVLRLGNGELMPDMDYAETDAAITVTAELPGVDVKDVDISLTAGMLTIRGEKKSEREEEKADYRFSERSYGSFERSIRVGDGVDADKVKADFENGVLTVVLPKKENVRALSRKIEVKTAH